jgi:glycosyltransferase involved in cell wall biosynthesis
MLSVIIITKNESRHITRCLESVAWADEIIVLDSGSVDNTVELCQRYTDKVFETDWPGFGIQKQRALTKASGDWVLSLDADEWITAELKKEIEQAITQVQCHGFEVPRLSTYCGKEIRHGGWWPDYVMRLFQRKHGHFTEDPVHERIIVTGNTAKLNTPLLHESFVDFEEVLNKINHYSSLGAEKHFQAGKKTSLFQAVFKGLWTFFKTYCLKASFLDGQEGLMLAISNAEGAYYKYLKLLFLQNTRDKQ